MIRSFATVALALAAAAATAWTLTGGQAVPTRAGEMAVVDAGPSGHPIAPLPLAVEVDARKAALGETLFFDARLSRDGTVSCAFCHDLKSGGDDGRRFPGGVGGAIGDINTPTVFNAAFNIAQFWDGRTRGLAEQVDGPILNPKEMAMTWPEVVDRLRRDAALRERFASLYADGVTAANIKDSIAAFERTLITPNARFDRYLRGEHNALTDQEIAGYRLFRDYGCASCHQGVNIGGNMYQKLGVMADYFADRGNVTRSDYGRFNVTGREADRYFFKVPSLRNVALTAPYFHDGTAASLEDAVVVMARYQLGRSLTRPEIERLVAFLETLTGQVPGE